MAEPSFMAMRRGELQRRGEEDYLRKRREIIVAAATVFKRKGFRSTSIADIAVATGLDRASLYLYIAGKEEVFQEVVLEATQENVDMVEALQKAEDPVHERISRLIRNLLISYARNYPFLFVYVQENMNQLDDGSDWSQTMRQLGRRFDDAVTSLIQQGIDDGSIRITAGGNAKAIAYGLIGLCNWTHRWFDPNGALSAEQIGRSYADMVLNGLRPR